MKKSVCLPFFVLLAAIFSFIGCQRSNLAGDSGVVNLIFSNITSESGVIAVERFVEMAERYSGETLNISVYQSNLLGDDRSVIDATRMGDIHIAVSSTSPLATIQPDLFLFDAPFLFLDSQAAHNGMDGPVGQSILDGFERVGLKGLAFWENGFRNFTNNRVIVRTPADVRDLKLRTMENEVHIAAWRAFGANPAPLPFIELFAALQNGIFEAQENPLGIIDANKLYEVQRHISITQHVYTPYIMLMNLRKFESLTPVQQQAILRAAEVSTTYQRKRSAYIEERVLLNLDSAGVVITKPTIDERAMFRQLIIENRIYDLIRARMDNPQLLDQLLQ